MNEGLLTGTAAEAEPERTQFFLGAVVTNHKRFEREVMPQYFKLRKKIENGAAFHYFERDEATGLSSTEVNRAYVASRRRPRGRGAPLRYRLSRLMHGAVFEPDSPLYPMARAFHGAVERGPRRIEKALHMVEQAAKVTLFSCRDCGDCSLPDIAYLCPESQCVKIQRNGPCGGTRQGKCEVGEKDCIWALAYERLKAYGEEESMLDGPVVIQDNALRGTSAWANTFLGRDHHARAGDQSAPNEGAL